MDLEQLIAFDIASTLVGFVSDWPDIWPWGKLPHRGLALWATSVSVRIIWRDLRSQESFLELQRETRSGEGFSVDPTLQE